MKKNKHEFKQNLQIKRNRTRKTEEQLRKRTKIQNLMLMEIQRINYAKT